MWTSKTADPICAYTTTKILLVDLFLKTTWVIINTTMMGVWCKHGHCYYTVVYLGTTIAASNGWSKRVYNVVHEVLHVY